MRYKTVQSDTFQLFQKKLSPYLIFFSTTISMTSLISNSVCATSHPLGAGFHVVQIILNFLPSDLNPPSFLLLPFLCPPSMSKQLSEVILSIL